MNVYAMLAAARLQLEQARRTPAQFLVLITSPVFTIIFLSVTRSSGNTAAEVSAVLGPALIGLWFISLDLASSVIMSERWGGTLEPMLATPAPLHAVVIGRITAIGGIGLLTMIESWVVALCFGVVLIPHHVLILVVTLIVTIFSTIATASLLAAGFVLTRNAYILQNSLTYPIYILGGVVLPVAALPGWLHPVSDVVFLSWSANLLRASFASTLPRWWVMWELVLAGLGVLALLIAHRLTMLVIRRIALTGSAAYA